MRKLFLECPKWPFVGPWNVPRAPWGPWNVSRAPSRVLGCPKWPLRSLEYPKWPLRSLGCPVCPLRSMECPKWPLRVPGTPHVTLDGPWDVPHAPWGSLECSKCSLRVPGISHVPLEDPWDVPRVPPVPGTQVSLREALLYPHNQDQCHVPAARTYCYLGLPTTAGKPAATVSLGGTCGDTTGWNTCDNGDPG